MGNTERSMDHDSTQLSKKSQREGEKKPRKRRRRSKRPAEEWSLSNFQVPEADDKLRFHDLSLCDELMHAIQDLGYEYCSPIQQKSLPHTLQGKDITGKAQTGTGKTAAFLITAIQYLVKHPIQDEQFLCEPRVLIIAPTRELVIQIAQDAKNLCKYLDLQIHTLIGGEKYDKQLHQMEQRVADIVVATPGRLIDFMSRKDIFLNLVEILVLDEADRMLDMGFIPQVKQIVRATPRKNERQTLLFSATFAQDILNLSRQWTENALHIEIEPEQVATETIDQRVYMVSNEEKLPVTLNILRQEEVGLSMIFTNRRDQAIRLHEKLCKNGIKAGVLTGEIAQNKRSKTLNDFKEGKLRVLVATDVVGRGIHIDGVTHVINYNLPEDPEDYVHRIGRTGRAGVAGISISFADETEAFQLPAIEELLGEKLSCTYPPESLLAISENA